MANSPKQSWTASIYSADNQALASVASTPLDFAPSYAALAGFNLSGSGTAVLQHAAPQAGLFRLANTNLGSIPLCEKLMTKLALMAHTTPDQLISQLQPTANDARNYIYDGPASNTPLDPVKFPDTASPGINTVGQWFQSGGNSYEALSQANGSAIFLRLDMWWSWANGLFSSFIKGASGKVNSYGMGTVTHETLHKQSVAGGFNHDQMDLALAGIGYSGGKLGQNFESSGIGWACFPDQ